MKLESETAFLRRELKAANARIDRLVNTLAAIAKPAKSPHVAAVSQNARVANPITEAIREESAGDPRLAGYLRKRARELKHGDKVLTDAEIAQELRTWDQTPVAD